MADTSQADYAIALTLGKYCEPENRAFIDCKELNEGKHIANCVEPMNNVLLCSSAVIKAVKDKCEAPYNSFSRCLDKNNITFGVCRKEQESFYKCLDNSKFSKELINSYSSKQE